MTKAEKEAEAKREKRRAYMREYWHKRTKAKTKKAKAYKKRKAETKAEWQKANKERHTQHVQAFYERWEISGREARAEGKKAAASAMKGKHAKPPRSSRQRDTGGKLGKTKTKGRNG
jgi:hypothetical protein